jgi:hypothetical protein
VGTNRVPNLFQPDCHEEIPYAVDVNIQMVAEPSPEGLAFYGVIGTNAFNPVLTGKRFKDLNWAQLMVWLGRAAPVVEEASGNEVQIRGPQSSDSNHSPTSDQIAPVLIPDDIRLPTVHRPLPTPGDFGEVQR